MPEENVFTNKIAGQPAWLWIGAGGVVVGGLLWWRHRQNAQKAADQAATGATSMGSPVPTAATSEELMAAGLYQPPNITYNAPGPVVDNGIHSGQRPSGPVPSPGSLISMYGGQEYYKIVNGHLFSQVLGDPKSPAYGVWDLGPVPAGSTNVTATGGNSGVTVTTYDASGNPTYTDTWSPTSGWTGPISKATNQTPLFPNSGPSATAPQTGSGAAHSTPSLHLAATRPRKQRAISLVQNPTIGRSPRGGIPIA